ncbi:ABC transporter G family member 33-like [Mangifera indica]|uniref:ABC transporter G family member 33-like n=1 Tax=Mangifera indica TaxID=29780 RepID=UPI001CFB77B1|nr:ABC transporter G family member 33-like [Mangifera indica]
MGVNKREEGGIVPDPDIDTYMKASSAYFSSLNLMFCSVCCRYLYEMFMTKVVITEGKVVYQGPRDQIVEFFKNCGFRRPQREGVADFLQEVIS